MFNLVFTSIIMKRPLTDHEIEEILGIFDTMYLSLPDKVRDTLIQGLKEPLCARLKTYVIDPFYIHKIKEDLARAYQAVDPGKPVGIITAQSVGEMTTQMNLNTFHQAGYRDKKTENSSRLQELTCTSQSETQSCVSCKIYYKEGVTREEMLSQLTYMTFGDYVLSFTTAQVTTHLSDWETVFIDHFSIDLNVQQYTWCRTYQINREHLYRFKTPLAVIVSKLKEACEEDVVYLFSPLYLGCIKVYARSVKVLRTAHRAFTNTYIHGLHGIVQAYFLPITLDSNELYIETEGSNLKEIYTLSFVDTYNTMSNDMWEIYDIFGIEAVRAFLVEEFTAIMPSVHFSHIELIADRMTVSGKLRSMTRYTRKSENKASVLSKITFEESLQQITDAAFKEQTDNVKGCSSSVICGRPPSTGSGMCDLVFQLEY